MTISPCLEAAMFAAAENYSLGVYELGECAESEKSPGERILFQQPGDEFSARAA